MNALTLTTVVAALAAHASADVLYSNFGEGDTYSLDTGWTIAYGGPLGGAVYETAVHFTVTGGDYYFDSVDLAVIMNWGPDLVFMDLCTDAGGVPGAVLESTSASGVTEPFVWAPPMTASFSGSVVLEEGASYWLTLRTDQTDALGGWAFNVVDDFGLYAMQINGGGWEPAYGVPGTDSQRAVFRVNGTPVPAPGAAGVLALAGASTVRRRRTR